MAQYRFERLQPEYARLWAAMTVTRLDAAIAEARQVIAHKDRYKAVERLTGVPWFVAGCLNLRESGGRFDAWAHNGDPMRDRAGQPVRTVNVTANRPPDPDVSWEEGCHDAYIVCEHFGEIDRWSPEPVAYAGERFNGFAYRNPRIGIPSPYLWGGTSVQKRGKFIRDHVYDATVMDPQLGVMAVLKALMQLDPEAVFPEAPPAPAPDDEPETPAAPAPRSPRADDTETEVKPLRKSRTIWGGLIGYAATAISTVEGFFDKLDNPYHLAAFLALLGAGGVATWLVISGRINVQKLVAHLSEDDTDA